MDKVVGGKWGGQVGGARARARITVTTPTLTAAENSWRENETTLKTAIVG